MKDLIKKLRELTGFGIADCRKALQDAQNDLDKALSMLKERGAEILKKKSERKTKEGLVDSYVHFSQNLGALVEVNCETDFVARSSELKNFVKDLAMHVAAQAPRYISAQDMPAQLLEGLSEREKEELIRENCLLNQTYVKDNSITVCDYLNSIAAKLKENIVIKRFCRFCLGEE